MRETYAAYETHVREAPAAALGSTVEFMGAQHEQIRILAWHAYHLIHHRGQLTMYLRMMGAKVPSTYGPSADEDHAG